MKTKSIAKICLQAALWPALILILLTCILSGILFTQHMQDIHAREINRHELIFQLLSKAVIGDVIIQNKHATYAVLREFEKKHDLNVVVITPQKPDLVDFSVIDLLLNNTISSSWKLAGISPSQYVKIESTIKSKDIVIPLSLSLGIILIFITASLLMYQRIRRQLHFRIVKPLQYTLASDTTLNNKRLNFNSAATEISELYHKTQAYIKALHAQRDIIEKSKIEEAKYRMALQVAHDIRSPALTLETISAISDLNSDSKSLIQKVIKRIIEIADNILETHAPHSSIPSTHQTSLGTILDNIIQEKKAYCPNKRIQFTKSIEPNCYKITVKIPTALLNRALSNLINNAIEAIGDNAGLVEITASADNQSVTISIADNGCGIPEENLPYIFDQNVSINKKSGKGLGLAFVKRVVEEYGGKVLVDSDDLRKTLFRVIFSY